VVEVLVFCHLRLLNNLRSIVLVQKLVCCYLRLLNNLRSIVLVQKLVFCYLRLLNFLRLEQKLLRRLPRSEFRKLYYRIV
jgi:hypothetical protein